MPALNSDTMTKKSSGDAKLDALIASWLEWNVEGSSDWRFVNDRVNAGDFDAVDDVMKKRLTFGTAGIRGVMGAGFGRMNDLVVIQTSQGLARYVKDSDVDATKKGVVIGFDARFNSQRWAKLAAAVFIREGFEAVRLFSKITPTPWVPFTVKAKSAAVGIMVTASHNPKEDNGYKVYWSNGPQICPPHDVNIQERIVSDLAPVAGDASFDVEDFIADKVLDPLEEMSDAYFASLGRSVYAVEINSRLDVPIVYTAMHGVGADYVDRAVRVAGFRPLVHVPAQRGKFQTL